MKRLSRIVISMALLVLGSKCYAQDKQSPTIPDSKINVITYEAMNYPPLALQTRVQGLVVLMLKLDTVGNVIDASALSGADLLVNTSLANARKWQFQPNAQHAVILVYNFRLSYAFGCESKSSLFTLEAPNLVNIIDCVRTVTDVQR